ncbi:aminoglycoside phosphotransferase family protein [Lysobacter sp. CA196]|uniref:aminoglycoside phosphotransferase family protein n=1 Tax=Lysobacter sp. CA196 TaxID=3455606 RepID=UPI003F8D66C1
MTPFDPHLAQWALVPDGAPIHTHSSDLLPVRYRDTPAMLKIPREPEERYGAAMMRWWDGDGAARVLAWDDDALLIERACGPRSLKHMARNGRDDDATGILCTTAARLHAPRAAAPPPQLLGLQPWFAELEPYANSHGGPLALAWNTACALLAEPCEVVPLHGDLHHENVLDAGAGGWVAIDPKRLIGERGFDFACLFTDPDAETALAPGRLARRADLVAQTAGLERRRLLQWIVAFTGLSAAWYLMDEESPDKEFAVIELANAELSLG